MNNPIKIKFLLDFLKTKSQLGIGLVLGFAIMFLIAFYVVHQHQQLNVLSHNTSKKTEAEKISSGIQTEGQQQTSQNSRTQTASPKVSSQKQTTTSGTTAPPPQSSPTVVPTPPASPTYLTTCIWQNGPAANQYCPYNPPSSWSTDFVSFPCKNVLTMQSVPCPDYRYFTAINAHIYSNNTQGLCQFTENSANIERSIVVNKVAGQSTYPDCTTATP